MGIAVVIVTYFPDLLVLKSNVSHISDFCSKVFIVDNSEITFEMGVFPQIVCLIRNGKNLGIARALNQGVQMAIENGFTYALLLDQDSIVTETLIPKLLGVFLTHPDAVMAIPRKLELNPLNRLSDSIVSNVGDIEEIEFGITSGSLIKLDLFQQIGFFQEELFIDWVDFEYCFRIREKGLKIYGVNSAILYHQLGNIKYHKFLGLTFLPTNHSPLRRFFKARNRVLIYRKYFYSNKTVILKNIIRCLWEILEIFLFERKKGEKVFAIFRGFVKGFLLPSLK